ncbi:MAG: hypothetical protein QXP42_01515 [Candidatus Micrarchaeia archaeon]
MNFDFGTALILVFIVSFVSTFFVAPLFIKKMTRKRVVSTDVHKPEKPLIPKIGGLIILFGFLMGALLSLQLHSRWVNVPFILAAISSITIIAIIGFVDDVLDVSDIYRVLTPLMAALPLIVVKAGTSTMNIPFFGNVNFDLGARFIPGIGYVDINLYILLLIPIGVVACSNLINLLAGFNGLEAGTGAIACLSILTATVILHARGIDNTESSFIMASMFAACLAFLIFNWYPAKVFPGNTATYAIGASIVCAVVLGNIEKIGVIALAPQIAEFLLKARSRFRAENFGKNINGRLHYDGEIYSLTHLIMRYLRPTEQQLVLILMLLQLVCGAIAVSTLFW